MAPGRVHDGEDGRQDRGRGQDGAASPSFEALAGAFSGSKPFGDPQAGISVEVSSAKSGQDRTSLFWLGGNSRGGKWGVLSTSHA